MEEEFCSGAFSGTEWACATGLVGVSWGGGSGWIMWAVSSIGLASSRGLDGVSFMRFRGGDTGGDCC